MSFAELRQPAFLWLTAGVQVAGNLLLGLKRISFIAG